MEDLASNSDSSSSSSCFIVEHISPVKAKECSFSQTMQLENMNEHDFHAEELSILARPSHALSVVQLFQLMIGAVPESRVCHRKPVGVRYSSVFVVDLSCVSSLNDIRADDNNTWVHGGKPRRKYSVEFDDNNVAVDAKLIKEDFSCDDENVFTLVRLYH